MPQMSLPLVVETYKRMINERGYASCGLVADELERMGIRTRTGRGPTRQGVHWLLKKSREGRDLLLITKRRVGKVQ